MTRFEAVRSRVTIPASQSKLRDIRWILARILAYLHYLNVYGGVLKLSVTWRSSHKHATHFRELCDTYQATGDRENHYLSHTAHGHPSTEIKKQ